MSEQACYLLLNDHYNDHKIDDFRTIMEKGTPSDKCVAMEKVFILLLLFS